METIGAAAAKGSFPLLRIMHPSASNIEGPILRAFSIAIATLAKETQRTLLEASATVSNFVQLQEHLLTIHDICERKGIELNEEHEEFLSRLWTILGGNRPTVGRNKQHIALLEGVSR